MQQYLIDLYLLNGCVNNIRLLTVMHIVYSRVISLRRGPVTSGILVYLIAFMPDWWDKLLVLRFYIINNLLSESVLLLFIIQCLNPHNAFIWRTNAIHIKPWDVQHKLLKFQSVPYTKYQKTAHDYFHGNIMVPSFLVLRRKERKGWHEGE